MDKDFEGRHVVVSGAGGELGLAVVRLLAERGATCHLPVRGEVRADRFGADPARVRVISGVDLTDESSVADYYAALPALWASVHCAGGFDAGPFASTPVERLERMMSVNARTAFLCCRAAIRRMGPDGGRIVNVVARPALEPATGAGMVVYAMSKAAVAALTVALAREVAERGIRVNAVAPSILDTPANRRAMPDADPTRWPGVDEVARTVAFLASPANRSVGGALLPIYGTA
jgi:NAD(P)-dependent dehydrogenase (short-subunit alcohol dehydrogenase family)